MNVTWTPCAWNVPEWPDKISQPTIELVPQMDGPDRFAVRFRGRCLTRLGEWEIEPMPSSRNDAFLKRCRFDTFEAAIDAASVPLRFLLIEKEPRA